MTPAITSSFFKVAGLAALLCGSAVAQQYSGTEESSLAAIVQGMEKSQSEVRAQGAYQVIREYRLSGAKSSNANAEVVAQVDSFHPQAKITTFRNGPALVGEAGCGTGLGSRSRSKRSHSGSKGTHEC